MMSHEIWMAVHPGKRSARLAPVAICHRLGFLRPFFERVMEWGYDDAPDRQLHLPWRLP